ncbi:MAG: nuclear transport factor 2 family protein [Pyrinomonadaceae bacterium]
MKRMIIFTALMLFTSGCVSNAQTQTNVNASSPSTSNTETKTTTTTGYTTKVVAAQSEADHIAREKQVYDMLKKKDFDGFAGMLADDMVEVEATGAYDKAGSVKGVRETDFSTASLSDFKVVKLDGDAVVVTYLAKFTAPGANAEGYRQSTVWVNRGGKWWVVFHQGTEAAKMAAAQPK